MVAASSRQPWVSPDEYPALKRAVSNTPGKLRTRIKLPAMHDTLQPTKSNRSLRRAVLVIILLGLGALAWEWHTAHNTPAKTNPTATKLTEP